MTAIGMSNSRLGQIARIGPSSARVLYVYPSGGAALVGSWEWLSLHLISANIYYSIGSRSCILFLTFPLLRTLISRLGDHLIAHKCLHMSNHFLLACLAYAYRSNRDGS